MFHGIFMPEIQQQQEETSTSLQLQQLNSSLDNWRWLKMNNSHILISLLASSYWKTTWTT